MTNDYVLSLFNHTGILINEENNQEIIYYFPLVFNEKNNTYKVESSYSIVSQPLGTYLIDFINTDLENIEEFKEFFLKYSFSLLDNSYKKLFKTQNFSRDEFDKFVNTVYMKKKSTLDKIQLQLDEILDYCIIHPKKRQNYTPLDRFVVLQSVHENLTILKEKKLEIVSFYKINDEKIANKSENELFKILADKNNKIEKLNVIIPNNIESMFYYILCDIMEQKLFFKVCKNCGNYFISNNTKIEYCDRTAPGYEQTCRQIGRLKTFQKSIYTEPLIEKYYKIYHKKSMLSRRNPDLQKYLKDFERFKVVGKNKLSDYKRKKISEEDFKNWLEKRS